ncbi:MAG: integrase family protein [Candidatus Thiodiazotropha endolucinida]|nr:integrase family protein [Candidatus Thiodiazotropha taylori]MCW4316479.1 integrase family protein [Candidatus Thiodiazotropha taylori]
MSTKRSDQSVKLTKTIVDRAAIPSDKKQVFIRDAALPGFGLRITDKGTKSFIVEKRVAGRVRRQTLGRFGPLTVEQARREAQKQLGKIAMRIDPIAEKKTRKAKAKTLAQVFEDFKKARKQISPITLRDYTHHLEKDLSDWLNKPITTITKHMVSKRHREIGERGAKAQANAVFRTLRSILNFARRHYEDGEGQSILPHNPVEVLGYTRAWYPMKRRKTVIKAYQLPAWYQAVEALKSPENPTSHFVIADLLRLILFTGLRSSEARKLRWEHVNFEDRTLTIPDPNNRHTFVLPLSDMVFDILQERRELALNEYVFPGKDGKGFLIEPKRQMARVTEQSGVDFKLHDLRRTYATILDMMDLSRNTIKRLLNHKSGYDVTDEYIVSDVERFRKPVQQVADFLKEQIGIQGRRSNVIPFKGRE